MTSSFSQTGIDVITIRNKVVKVMFLHLSVSHSVHSVGGGGSASVHAGIPIPTPPVAGTPKSRHPPRRHPPEQAPPGADPPGAGHLLEQAPPGAGTTPQEQAPPPGSRLPEQAPTPADGYCCGRYASFWNTFLLC